MSKSKNIANIVIPLIAAGVISTASPRFVRADVYTEQQCKINYSQLKNAPECQKFFHSEQECRANYSQLSNAPECQEVYKKFFVTGSQGPITNTLGPCEDGIDNDGDGFPDTLDADCHNPDGKYLPGNPENNPKLGPFPKVIPQPIPAPIAPTETSSSTPEQKVENTYKGIEAGVTVAVTPTTSEVTPNKGIKSNFKGTGMNYGGYLRFPLSENVNMMLDINTSTLEQDISNDTYDNLGSLKMSSFKGGLVVEFKLVDGKLVLEPGIAYGTQDIKTTIKPLGVDLEEKIKETEVSFNGWYNFFTGKNNIKYGAMLGVTESFLDIIQKEINKKATVGTYELGLTAQRNKWEAYTALVVDEIYNVEANKKLNGTGIEAGFKYGNNLYVFAEGQGNVANSGLSENSFGIGLGVDEITKGKLKPFGARIYFANVNTDLDNGLTEANSSQNVVGLQLIFNGKDWFRSKRDPLRVLYNQ